MNFFKRGLLSIIRKPTKTIILFLVVFILGILMSGAVSIKNSINNTESSINGAVEPVAIIEMDWEMLEKDTSSNGGEDFWESIVYPDISLIQTIGALEHVKYYDYTIKQYVSFQGEQPEGIAIPYLPEDEQQYYDKSYLGSLYLTGVNFPEIMPIQEGVISLSAGRVLTQEEVEAGKPVAVIGEKFASKNNLEVGSTLTTNYGIYDYRSNPEASGMPPLLENYPIEMEVVGIFKVPEKPQDENQMYGMDMSVETENTIYTTNGYATKLQQEIYEKETELYNEDGVEPTKYEASYSPIYVLKEATMLEDFREEATPLLPKYHKIVDTTESYSALKAPLENLGGIANIVLMASIGVTVLILSLLTTLFLHDRRHEIGIYISMGERKIKVISQILVEVMMIAIVSLSISLFVGNVLTKDMSKDMLLDDAQDSITNNNNSYQYHDFGGIASGEPVYSTEMLEENYEVALDGGTIALFYGVSIATIAVSTIVPTLYILRLKPKKILM